MKNLKQGKTVLIHAGSGALGLAMIQMAKRAGATVFAPSSDDAKLQRLEEYGVHITINNAHENFPRS